MNDEQDYALRCVRRLLDNLNLLPPKCGSWLNMVGWRKKCISSSINWDLWLRM